ncbi:hypothetical protein D7V94_16250 [Parablautia intestinalis]|uniref:Uncharacterized protein n=1 Tax=Parablautia intestinalis TaxID=2320100 RepID=A0A3A9ADR2_9FIRM|nr:hypothetical protein D7V94_16250 [Parablautia intestinalis]
MKKKIFFSALILFVVFLNSTILIVSTVILRDKLSAVRDKCLAEHYVIASSLIRDVLSSVFLNFYNRKLLI